MSSNRKTAMIAITTNLDKILDIVNYLKLENSGQITATLIADLKESKELYKYLSTDENISDWYFIDEPDKDNDNDKTTEKEATLNESPILETTATNQTQERLVTEESPIVNQIIDLLNINSVNEISTLVEATWQVSKKSPNIIFGGNLFLEALKEQYSIVGNKPISIEHALLSKIIESCYYENPLEFIIDDTLERIKNNWKLISTYNTITEVAVKLYKK